MTQLIDTEKPYSCCFFIGSLDEHNRVMNHFARDAAFAPAEVHQTPESQSHAHDGPSWADPNCGSCGGSGYTSSGGCYVCQKRAAGRIVSNAPDQHVAPPRIWIRPGDAEYSTVALEYDNDDIEYAHLAPIQAALEKCATYPKNGEFEYDFIVRKSDWDALVALIKGERTNGK